VIWQITRCGNRLLSSYLLFRAVDVERLVDSNDRLLFGNRLAQVFGEGEQALMGEAIVVAQAWRMDSGMGGGKGGLQPLIPPIGIVPRLIWSDKRYHPRLRMEHYVVYHHE